MIAVHRIHSSGEDQAEASIISLRKCQARSASHSAHRAVHNAPCRWLCLPSVKILAAKNLHATRIGRRLADRIRLCTGLRRVVVCATAEKCATCQEGKDQSSDSVFHAAREFPKTIDEFKQPLMSVVLTTGIKVGGARLRRALIRSKATNYLTVRGEALPGSQCLLAPMSDSQCPCSFATSPTTGRESNAADLIRVRRSLAPPVHDQRISWTRPL